MWRICRQILTGRWNNIKQVPSSKGNQTETAVEGKEICYTSRFCQEEGFNSRYHEKGHSNKGSANKGQKETLFGQLLKPSLVDTFSWLGASAAIAYRLQRYFCTSSEKERNSSNSTGGHSCAFWQQLVFYLSQNNATFRVLPKGDFVSPSKADLSKWPPKSPSSATQAPKEPKRPSVQKFHNKSQVALVAQSQTVASIEESFHQLNSVATECAGLMENQMGIEAATKNQEKAAFDHFHYSAINFGCIKAHFNLGVCYEIGCGTNVDLHKAAYHYAVAAKQDHPAALYNLGLLYMEGKGGLPKDTNKGFFYIQRSAEKEFSEALLYLGIHHHENGRHSKAVRYFQAAACKDDPNAFYYLGLCYQHGWGLTRSSSQALAYFEKASLRGLANATFALAQLYEHGSDEIAQDLSQASAMYQLAAQQGHPKAAHKHLEMDLISLGAIKHSKPSNATRESSPGRPIHISSSTSNLKESEKQENGVKMNLPSSYLGLILPAFQVCQQHLLPGPNVASSNTLYTPTPVF